MKLSQEYNGFTEKAIKAAKEHQAGNYEWQEEKRKSFINGASFGYFTGLEELGSFKLDIKYKLASLVGELKICQKGKPSFYLPNLIEEVEAYIENL